MKRKKVIPYFEFNAKMRWGQWYYYPHNELARKLFHTFANRKSRVAFTYEQVLWFKRCGAEIKVNKEEDKKNKALEVENEQFDDYGQDESGDGGGREDITEITIGRDTIII